MVFIYGLYFGKRIIYVGRTKNIIMRAGIHYSNAVNLSGDNGNLYNFMHKMICDGIAPICKILDYVPTDEAKRKEEEAILKHKDFLFANKKMTGEAMSFKKITKRYKKVKIGKKVRESLRDKMFADLSIQLNTLLTQKAA